MSVADASLTATGNPSVVAASAASIEARPSHAGEPYGTVTFDNATGLVVANLDGSYTGGVGGTPTLKIDFYVPQYLRDGVTPVLDPAFRPAALATRAFRAAVRATGSPVPVTLALEQTDGSVFHFHTELAPAGHALAAANFSHVERLAKFLLWQRGGWRFHFTGPSELAAQLQNHFRETATGKFDSNMHRCGPNASMTCR